MPGLVQSWQLHCPQLLMTVQAQLIELMNQSEFEEFLVKVEQEMVEVEVVPLLLLQGSELLLLHLPLLLVDLLTMKPGDPQAVISVLEFQCQVEPSQHAHRQAMPDLILAVLGQHQVATELVALFLDGQQQLNQYAVDVAGVVLLAVEHLLANLRQQFVR